MSAGNEAGRAASAEDGAPDAAALADALDLLRAWDAGVPARPPKGRLLDLLAFADRNRIAWPICVALESALPAPAAMLAAPRRREAEARAEALARQFRALAETLAGARIDAVAVKGAAALAEAGGAAAPWREMQDLDLLVAPEDLERAVAALLAAGHSGDTEAYVATDYHFPALQPPPGGVVTVEIHTRLGWSRRGPLAGVAERAGPGPLPHVLVPSPEDRLAHLVHHAQIGDRGWERRILRLRDMLDWRAFRRAGPCDLESLAARFDEAGEGDAFRAYAALMQRLWEEPAPQGWAEDFRDWGDDALAALADPELAGRRRREDAAPALIEALTTRETLLHLLAGIANPARLRRFLRRLTS